MVRYNTERLSAEQYIDFLKRTDLGLQYPKERFKERIERLVANENAIPFYEKLGMKLSDEVMVYDHVEWTNFKVE